jgi:hypothetical protein
MISLIQAEAIDRYLPMRSTAKQMVEKHLARISANQAAAAAIIHPYKCLHLQREYERAYDEWFCPECCIQWRVSC